MIYFYCTSWQFFHIIVKWRISPTTEQIMFTFSILLFHFYSHIPCGMWLSYIWSIKITKIISTHTSRVGCDYNLWRNLYIINIFLLTHPVWDVTTIIVFSFLHTKISTHTSRVGCDELVTAICLSKWRISTHTSRVGCDVGDARCSVLRCRFLLTHPVWDVTQNVCHVFFYTSISTHTSRVGCDSRMQLGFSCIFISTHTSRVGCDSAGIPLGSPGYIFLLTHPVWDVTSRLPLLRQRLLISTHTSRVGCDIISKITVKNHQ